MKNTGKKVAVGIVCGLAVVLGISVFLRLTKKEEAIEDIPLTAVSVETPQTGTIILKTGLTGTIEAADTVYVIPKGTGEVSEVYVKMGDTVEKDQKLFKLDNSKQIDAARIAMNQAQISVNDAQTNLDRMKVLFESGDISSQAYEQYASALSQARLGLQSAKLSYDTYVENGTVTAPIGGLLEQFDVEEHDMISGGSVGVISGEGSRSVSFAVSERVMKGLSVGDSVTVEKNGTEYPGVITEISTMVDAATGLFKAKASMNGADGLATGTTVKLYVTDQKAENVMTLPVDCVNYAGGDAYVYTYANGTIAKKNVEEGLIDETQVEIRSGLDWSDEVVVTWSKELYDGAEVRLVEDTGSEGVTAEGTAAETAADAAETAAE